MALVTRRMKRRFLAALEGIDGGRLRLVTPEGDIHDFGTIGPEAEMRLHDWAVLSALARRGDIGLGETWMERRWTSATLGPLLTLGMRNAAILGSWRAPSLPALFGMRLAGGLLRGHGPRAAARNIRAHYDVGNEFFLHWLDPGMSYSAALFAPGDDDLDRAQARKIDRVLTRLAPGDSVLELGCGWGGFAEAAADRGRRVTGVTLSPNQRAYADARLDGRAEIRLQDYRAVRGRFDNIVSIEMIAAVGERGWPAFFATIKARLAPDGKAVIQAITVPDGEFSTYRGGPDFVRRHVFPGGLLPCDAAIKREAGRAGLAAGPPFAFGPHYARTCRIWSDRMMAARNRLLRLGHGEAFLRGWQFCLEGSAAAFATGRTDVVQIELRHDDRPGLNFGT